MRRRVVIAVTLVVGGFAALFLGSAVGASRHRAEREHGVRLPASARHIQCRGNAWRGFLDRGAATMFEMSTNDLSQFVAQLRVRSRTAPVRTVAADPTAGGFNVWPRNSRTFVPGDRQYGGFRRTWSVAAVPIDMLSCDSPTGDWLHVELWRLEEGMMLVKMYTDWN